MRILRWIVACKADSEFAGPQNQCSINSFTKFVGLLWGQVIGLRGPKLGSIILKMTDLRVSISQ